MGSRKEKGELCEMGKSDHVLCLDRVVVTNFCSGSHMGTAKNGRSRSIVGLAGSGRPQNWIGVKPAGSSIEVPMGDF